MSYRECWSCLDKDNGLTLDELISDSAPTTVMLQMEGENREIIPRKQLLELSNKYRGPGEEKGKVGFQGH